MPVTLALGGEWKHEDRELEVSLEWMNIYIKDVHVHFFSANSARLFVLCFLLSLSLENLLSTFICVASNFGGGGASLSSCV